jgi:DNA-directed RNA polymerase sigma subunit (sigma70/sigma32)
MRKISEIREDNRRRFAAYVVSSDLKNSSQFEDYLSENSKLALKINNEKLKKFLESSFNKLDFGEREILDLRHGLDGGEPYSLNEIAGIFNNSRNEIIKKYNMALNKIRPYFEALLSLH